jgi:hypothetical protein
VHSLEFVINTTKRCTESNTLKTRTGAPTKPIVKITKKFVILVKQKVPTLRQREILLFNGDSGRPK